MNSALLTSLEPLLLQRAEKLARSLPHERRGRVRALATASRVRARLAREAREPEALPAAACLGREALALSVSALLCARGELSDSALSPAAALDALEGLAAQGELTLPQGEFLSRIMRDGEPSYPDTLGTDELRRGLAELDVLLERVSAHYEARSPLEVGLARALRLALLLILLTALVVAFATLAFPHDG